MNETVESSFHIRMNSKGKVTSVTKGKPKLGRDEIAFLISVVVPASVFRSSVFEAELEIKESQVIVPEIQVNIDDAPVACPHGRKTIDLEDVCDACVLYQECGLPHEEEHDGK